MEYNDYHFVIKEESVTEDWLAVRWLMESEASTTPVAVDASMAAVRDAGISQVVKSNISQFDM